LSDDVTFLVRSLGGVVHRRFDAHILDIRLPTGTEPFRLGRKLEKYRVAGGGRPRRFIDSIEPVGRSQAVCISVAAADSLYVTEDFLLTHNTLNDSFIILDEAQNTSPEQMKMFLTRLGFGAKIVVTGDVTQVDLPSGTQSGLRIVRGILEGIEDVHFSELTSSDVVRHRLVSEIVDAYSRWDAVQNGASEQRPPARREAQRRSRR
jgi:phosphate starvation-inducible PhoH-like protein